MDGVLDTAIRVLRTGANVVAYLASKLGYEIDTTTVLTAIATGVALYFALLSLYHTVTYTIRTIFWLVKWATILFVLVGAAGFIMSGGKAFTLAPVLEMAVSYLLKLIGWGFAPQVDLGPEGVRVNGVPMELPADFHQYGNAWSKFRSSATKASGKKQKQKQKPPSIFAPFAANKKSRKAKNTSGVQDAAAVAQRLLAGDLNMGDAWQSVEAIQRGVAESLDAVKAALGVGDSEEVERTHDRKQKERGWIDWWNDWRESDEDGGTSSR